VPGFLHNSKETNLHSGILKILFADTL
jgi:hypothetical protein